MIQNINQYDIGLNILSEALIVILGLQEIKVEWGISLVLKYVKD